MKKYIIISIFVLVSIKTFSQSCWDVDNTPTTDWRNYPPSGNAQSANQWNWTADYPNFGDAYITTNKNPITQQVIPIPLPSPFYSPYSSTYNNENLLFLQSRTTQQKDFWPEDGWELLIKNFGECPNPPNCYEATAIDHPFFALYNRYTGKVRAFMMVTQPPADLKMTGALITMSFINSGVKRALFSHAVPVMKTVGAFDPNTSQGVPNQYVNEANFWLVGDFQMAYDPCTCNDPTQASYLQFQYKLLYDSQVSLTGDFIATEQIIQNTEGGVSPDTDGNLALFGGTYNFSDLIGTGAKAYKTYNGYRDNVNKFLNSQKQEVLNDLNEEFFDQLDGELYMNGQHITSIEQLRSTDDGMKKMLGLDNASFDELNSINEANQFYKGIASSLPYIGTAYGIVDFFISGATKKPETKPYRAPTTFEGTLSIQGTINSQNVVGSRIFNTPGYTTATGTGVGLPNYNNTLGIFNIMTPPNMEYVNYVPKVNNVVSQSASDNNSRVRQYKLSQPMKFVVNPTAHLEVLSIDAAYEIEFDTDFYEEIGQPQGNSFIANQFIAEPGDPLELQNLTFQQRMSRVGLEVDYFSENYPTSGVVRVRTKYVPICNFTDMTFFLFKPALTGGFYPNKAPRVFIKLFVTLRRTDVSDAEYLTILQSYEIPNGIQSATKNGTNQNYIQGAHCMGSCQAYLSYLNIIESAPVYFTDYYNTDLHYSNRSFTSGTITATGSIYIGTDVTMSSGVNMTAGQNIFIEAENTYDGEHIFQIQNNMNTTPCTLAGNKATNQEILATCNSSVYRSSSGTGTKQFVVTENTSGNGLSSGNAQSSDESLDINLSPVPVSTSATLNYSLPSESYVTIEVTDLYGKAVISVVNSQLMPSGKYQQPIDFSSVIPGMYICKLISGNVSVTKKIVVTK